LHEDAERGVYVAGVHEEIVTTGAQILALMDQVGVGRVWDSVTKVWGTGGAAAQRRGEGVKTTPPCRLVRVGASPPSHGQPSACRHGRSTILRHVIFIQEIKQMNGFSIRKKGCMRFAFDL
jgi:hypothetical protein